MRLNKLVGPVLFAAIAVNCAPNNKNTKRGSIRSSGAAAITNPQLQQNQPGGSGDLSSSGAGNVGGGEVLSQNDPQSKAEKVPFEKIKGFTTGKYEGQSYSIENLPAKTYEIEDMQVNFEVDDPSSSKIKYNMIQGFSVSRSGSGADRLFTLKSTQVNGDLKNYRPGPRAINVESAFEIRETNNKRQVKPIDLFKLDSQFQNGAPKTSTLKADNSQGLVAALSGKNFDPSRGYTGIFSGADSNIHLRLVNKTKLTVLIEFRESNKTAVFRRVFLTYKMSDLSQTQPQSQADPSKQKGVKKTSDDSEIDWTPPSDETIGT